MGLPARRPAVVKDKGAGHGCIEIAPFASWIVREVIVEIGGW